jgi:hypothetical protein
MSFADALGPVNAHRSPLQLLRRWSGNGLDFDVVGMNADRPGDDACAGQPFRSLRIVTRTTRTSFSSTRGSRAFRLPRWRRCARRRSGGIRRSRRWLARPGFRRPFGHFGLRGRRRGRRRTEGRHPVLLAGQRQQPRDCEQDDDDDSDTDPDSHADSACNVAFGNAGVGMSTRFQQARDDSIRKIESLGNGVRVAVAHDGLVIDV